MRDTPAIPALHRDSRQLMGAFAAMVFVCAAWGANLPVSKEVLRHIDVIPMTAMRTVVATITLGLMLWLIEGRTALRIELALGRFLALGLIMGSFFAVYALGLYFSNPITAAMVQVAGPLISALTVRFATGHAFDPGFGVALALSLLGGAILSSSNVFGAGHVTFGGGEIIVLGSNVLWTLYAIKAQEWFQRESQLHRAYVASVSAMGWLGLAAVAMVVAGLSRSPFLVKDGWVWTQLITIAALAGGIGSYGFNIGASRLGVAIASLWLNLLPFFAVMWAMTYGYRPNAYQIAGGLVALSGVVYMQWRKLTAIKHA
jgi:drug/metabolite transporter (DMT)-like permease